jgi:hypothetical protein
MYSLSKKDHVHDVQIILKRLQQYKLFAKLSKCVFHITQVNFLGFVISPAGISMEEDHI